MNFGRKISVTEPSSAPRFSAYTVKGHLQPLTSKTPPSRSMKLIPIHVRIDILSRSNVKKTMPTHMIIKIKINVWTTLMKVIERNILILIKAYLAS